MDRPQNQVSILKRMKSGREFIYVVDPQRNRMGTYDSGGILRMSRTKLVKCRENKESCRAPYIHSRTSAEINENPNLWNKP